MIAISIYLSIIIIELSKLSALIANKANNNKDVNSGSVKLGVKIVYVPKV